MTFPNLTKEELKMQVQMLLRDIDNLKKSYEAMFREIERRNEFK